MQRHANPSNPREIATFGLLAVAGFTLGSLWIFLEDGFEWLAVTIGVVLALFVFIMTAGRVELVDRPREVEVSDSGVVLHQRFGRKPVFLSWLDVTGVSHALVDMGKWNLGTTSSYIRASGKRRYTVTRHIGEAVRERYRAQVGRYPPNRMDNKGRGATPGPP